LNKVSDGATVSGSAFKYVFVTIKIEKRSPHTPHELFESFRVFFPNAELIQRVGGKVRVSRAARSPEMI
jgi:hypothetical protein